MLRNSVGGHCLHRDQHEDRSSGRVRNSLENVASHKIELRSRSVANIRATERLRKIYFLRLKSIVSQIFLIAQIISRKAAKGAKTQNAESLRVLSGFA